MSDIDNSTRADLTDYSSDPIITAVIKANAPYKNSDYAREPPIKLGSGTLHVVTFKGGDNNVYVNYVYSRKGQVAEVYYDLRRLVAEKSGGLFPIWDLDWLRTVAMFIIIILLLSAASLTASTPDGKAFTAFMSTLTAALGYLAGRGTKSDNLPA